MNSRQNKIDNLVERLELMPHPEGGYYKEIYRSQNMIPKSALGEQFSGDRSYCTSIYFLITSSNFSGFHKINQDEIWHFYEGSALYVHVIDHNGKYKRHEVGMSIENGEVPQLVVPAGCWFASSVKEKDNYSFTGCTVAPGFDFDDFELANKKELIQLFPQHEKIIDQYTRK